MHYLVRHSVCLILIFSSARGIFSQENNQTAYELLSSYDFPVGILPQGVIGYEMDESTGKFSVFWKDQCTFNFYGPYQLRYESTVKGYLSKGRISSCEGVSVNLLLGWLDIIEVSRIEDLLYFYVEIGTEARWSFPARKFKVSPQCGCGYHCGDERKSSSLQY